jgi:hypothetical protein
MPHNPLYIVASPQPRVGKTLIARLLIEYLLANNRPLIGYDLDSREPSLARHFPDSVRAGDITDTLGQMALFDRLIGHYSRTSVIDLGYSVFEQFFTVMREIGFEQEARRQMIEPIVLFVTDAARPTANRYAELQSLLPHTVFVPVHNESVSFIFTLKDFPPSRAEYGVIRIPRLSPIVRGVIDRPSFSFRAYMTKQPGGPTEVHGWINAIFTAFREFELRLLMGRLSSSLGTGAATTRQVQRAPRP